MRSETNVVDLRQRRIERLVVDLTRELLNGYVIVEVAEIDSVDEWRAAARLAARRHGGKVRTGLGQTHGQVFAARVDAEAEQGWTGWS
jgi:hypothetical protein